MSSGTDTLVPRRSLDVDPARLALWVFLAATAMLFGAFASAYLVRMASGAWTPVALPTILWLNTGVLLASSVALEAARGDRARTRVGVAAGLGILFIAGQAVAWAQLAEQGVFLPTSPHSAFFYVLTAVHALHLSAGLGCLAWAYRGAAKTPPSRFGGDEPARRLSLARTYWHFMGGLWVFLLAVLRLGGA
ncbi:MAG: cytochrome c oxidase subunit 3 [Thermoanaerobaculia bacterium]|nr:cytochrome c oxidase subunit 3 [Thermoanaerobaculia bacterium]